MRSKSRPRPRLRPIVAVEVDTEFGRAETSQRVALPGSRPGMKSFQSIDRIEHRGIVRD